MIRQEHRTAIKLLQRTVNCVVEYKNTQDQYEQIELIRDMAEALTQAGSTLQRAYRPQIGMDYKQGSVLIETGEEFNIIERLEAIIQTVTEENYIDVNEILDIIEAIRSL